MSSSPPKDCLGNELHEGDIVHIETGRPLIMRVMKLVHGGVATPQGITPGAIVVGVTLTLTFVPGAPLAQLVKVVSPGNDEYVKKLLDAS